MGAFDWAGGGTGPTSKRKSKAGGTFDWAGGSAAPSAPAAPIEAPSHLWETTKGLGRGLIDVLSRPNYAVAGAAEEAFAPQGGGLAAVPGRVVNELLSGVGSLKGQKEGFAQVMEQSGVSELGKLSDVLPIYNDTGEGAALKRGGWADPTGRGALGLVGDIFLDPTTYVTAGGNAARRLLTNTGVKYLSKEGKAVLASVSKELEPAFKIAGQETDDVLRVTARRQVHDELKNRMDKAIAANPKLLDPTGVKIFGQEVISPKSLEGLSDTAKSVVLSVPGGGVAARGAEALGTAIRRVFDPYADLAGLPKDTREAMKGVIRENRSSAAMHKTNLMERWHGIEPGWASAARKYGRGEEGKQRLGKMFADWREQTGTVKLSPAETDLFGKIAKVYDDSEAVALREGLITPEQATKYGGKYLHHEYTNPEVLTETAKRGGRGGAPIVTEQFQRERQFDTLAEAVAKSKELHAETQAFRAAGGKGKVYGELVPEYDAMKNLGSYIQQFTDGVWRKKTYQEAREKFGLELEQFDPGLRYALDAPKAVPVADRSVIDSVLRTPKGEVPDLLHAAQQIPKLSADGQRELARELVSAAKSPSQVVNIREALGEHLMPDLKIAKPGDVDPYFAKLGQDGTLVPRQGGLWGDKEILIPAQIAKMIEDAPRDIVMDQARKVGLQNMVGAFDWYNNAFKAVTYPFYPSGAVRDTYNNVMQAFLGIGVGAFARPTQAIRALRGHADDVLRLGEREYTAKEVKTLAKDLGVIDPSAAAYVQFTGEQGAKRSGFLAKARAKRGSVDNLTRTQLFINNISAGMTPEDSAQVVKEFLFDYGELSPVDRDIMRRAMPFWTFPRKAIESYGVAAVKTPGRVINMAKPFRGREDENNAMTTWEGEGFKLRLDRNGKDITMLNGVDLPVKTLDLLWAGSPQKTMDRMLGMASPAIKGLYEVNTGRDPFRGAQMGRGPAPTLGPALEHLPKIVQEWAGYKKEFDAAGRPKYTVRQDHVQILAEAALVSRIISTSDRNLREQLREPNTAARFLDFLTGLRAKTLNLDEQQKAKLAVAQKIAEDEAVKQGAAREFRKVYVPKGGQ